MIIRRDTSLALAILATTTLGCGDRSRHAQDGDTGAAAPATRIDMSRTPRVGDSTAAVANPTGRADAASGDTTGTRAKDSTKGRNAGRPTNP